MNAIVADPYGDVIEGEARTLGDEAEEWLRDNGHLLAEATNGGLDRAWEALGSPRPFRSRQPAARVIRWGDTRALTDMERRAGGPAEGWHHEVVGEHLWADRAKVEARLAAKVWVESADRVEPFHRLKEHKGSHWYWVGASPERRGRICIGGYRYAAPRALWQCLRGVPSVARVVANTCGEDQCVNPWHAELVDNGEWLKKA